MVVCYEKFIDICIDLIAHDKERLSKGHCRITVKVRGHGGTFLILHPNYQILRRGYNKNEVHTLVSR